MSSRHDDAPTDTRAQRLVQERQERLEAVLDVYEQQGMSVELTPQMKREIATHILSFARILSKYKDENVLSDGEWPDIEPIRQRRGKTTRVVASGGGMGRGTSYQEVPAIDELGFEYLEAVADQLGRVAKTLGFWPDAEQQTAVFGVDPDHEEGDA